MPTPFRTDVFRRLGTIAIAPTINLLAFLLPMLVVTIFPVKIIRDLSEWLVAHRLPWVALTFVVLAGLLWAGLLSMVKPAHARNRDGRVLPGFALGFAAAASALWIYLFSSLSYVLFKLGLVSYDFKGPLDNALPYLSDAYLWYLLDLIPGLEVNKTLGWEQPVSMNGGWPGALLLLFRIVVLFQVFALGRSLLKASATEPESVLKPTTG